MAKNNNLHTAKATKNDEFYTQLEDIENELKYYKDYFNGKVVYCNCDGFLNKEKSNFFIYFSLNYEFLGLKGLICTKYNPNGKGKKYEYYGDLNGNNYPDEEEVFTSELEGDGDFRSEECIELLKKCDIVCTNPPFRLFRQYVAQLFEYKKNFLIIGNVNAISYKEVFPLIKENKDNGNVPTERRTHIFILIFIHIIFVYITHYKDGKREDKTFSLAIIY